MTWLTLALLMLILITAAITDGSLAALVTAVLLFAAVGAVVLLAVAIGQARSGRR